jgi:hypothetical protein
MWLDSNDAVPTRVAECLASDFMAAAGFAAAAQQQAPEYRHRAKQSSRLCGSFVSPTQQHESGLGALFLDLHVNFRQSLTYGDNYVAASYGMLFLTMNYPNVF